MTADLHQRVGRLSLEDKVRLLTGRTGWILHAAGLDIVMPGPDGP